MNRKYSNYRIALLLIVIIALSLLHDEGLLPVRTGFPGLSTETSYTIERFIFLGIGIFAGTYFGKKTGIAVLCIALAAMLVNAFLLAPERTLAIIETPLIFITGLFIVFLFDSRRKISTREKALKEAESLGRIGSWEYDIKTGKLKWSDETYALYEKKPASRPPDVETALK